MLKICRGGDPEALCSRPSRDCWYRRQSERVLSEFNADPKICIIAAVTPPGFSKEQPYDSYRVFVKVDEFEPD